MVTRYKHNKQGLETKSIHNDKNYPKKKFSESMFTKKYDNSARTTKETHKWLNKNGKFDGNVATYDYEKGTVSRYILIDGRLLRQSTEAISFDY